MHCHGHLLNLFLLIEWAKTILEVKLCAQSFMVHHFIQTKLLYTI